MSARHEAEPYTAQELALIRQLLQDGPDGIRLFVGARDFRRVRAWDSGTPRVEVVIGYDLGAQRVETAPLTILASTLAHGDFPGVLAQAEHADASRRLGGRGNG